MFYTYHITGKSVFLYDWKQLDNTDLNELAKTLPTIAKSSKSANSIKKYSFAFNKFKSWCTNYNLCACFLSKSQGVNQKILDLMLLFELTR
jgi:hypothetical protein